MDAFKKALDFIFKVEGGFTNDPDDPGGPTKFGISQKAYPDLDVEHLTEDEAARIYRRDYWEKLRCDKIPFPVNIISFDAAVNCGPHRAAIWLQNAIQMICKRPVLIDGSIGPKTLAAMQHCDPYRLALLLISMRLRYYTSLPRRLPYLRGWVNRVATLIKFLLEEK